MDLEAKKQALLEQLKQVATCDKMNPVKQLEKLEVLHKRLNAIGRYQAESAGEPEGAVGAAPKKK